MLLLSEIVIEDWHHLLVNCSILAWTMNRSLLLTLVDWLALTLGTSTYFWHLKLWSSQFDDNIWQLWWRKKSEDTLVPHALATVKTMNDFVPRLLSSLNANLLNALPQRDIGWLSGHNWLQVTGCRHLCHTHEVQRGLEVHIGHGGHPWGGDVLENVGGGPEIRTRRDFCSTPSRN